MENSSNTPVVPVMVALLLIGALATVVWVAQKPSGEVASDSNSGEQAIKAERTVAVTNARKVASKVDREGSFTRDRNTPLVDGLARLERDARLEEVREEGEPVQDVSRETLESWAINPGLQKVPERWVPALPPEEEEAIRKTFEKPLPEPIIWLDLRRQSIDFFKIHAQGCFEELQQRVPDARGRAIVIWEIAATGGIGQAQAVRLGPVVDLQDVGFLDCLMNVPFPVWPTKAVFDSVTIEYPLILP